MSRLSSFLLLVASALLALTAPGAAAQPAEDALAAAPVAPAAPIASLSLAEAVDEALARHPSVVEARRRHEAAAARSEEARVDGRPTAGFNASATRYQEPTVVTPIHGFGPGQLPEFDRSVGRGELSVRYDLYDGGADAARLGAARAEEVAAGEGVEMAEDELVARTVSAYVRVLSLAAVGAAQDDRLAAFDAERERVEQLFAVGRAADVDRKRVRAARADAAAERQSTAAALDATERELARLTGRDAAGARAALLQPVHLAEPAPAREALAERALAASPAVARAEARAAAAASAIELARSRKRPRLAARGAYQEFASTQGLETGEWQAGLEVTVPLFDGGRVAAGVLTAEAERDAARAAADGARLAVLDGLDRALAALEQARARAASLGEAVDGYAEVARVEALRLANGAGTQSDLLDAEADLLAARAHLVEARFARVAARTEIARITGALDAAWVDENLVAATGSTPGAIDAATDTDADTDADLPEAP